MNIEPSAIELHFLLDIDDDWPPVSLEGIPCTQVEDGYRVDVPPLFVKGLSVGDVIKVTQNTEGEVMSWEHVQKSDRTTIWLLRIAETQEIEKVLERLHKLKCKTVQLPQYGCYSIDVPAECPLQDIDACLASLDSSRVAVAYPSFRHEEYDE
ncbi:MAG: DUF4265 domain-containing protein [Gammaproteobacteria bacterium]